ncbi:type II toxin-antitoxin system HicB family antitoxin [Microcoleus sp. herbarium12]|jgi:predicted RNase H-like HicB family nuclease|uniref:type II toxin-antitoxin system HicB family antitoxin n=1 Tax=Microcoleus sp. herbarium12 TaxID=3055437 RepID=UPI002FD7133C
MKYKVIIDWSEEDQVFIAEVPELPGCAADGENYQEALQNLEIIMQEWIETANALGRPIPQPKGRSMFA